MTDEASDERPPPNPWHRLFGLSLIDLFQGTDVTVELEVDLSQRQQFVDVVLIRKGTGPIPIRLPDGFDRLAPHNLVSFKSHHESLDGWTLCELIGHYVNYRKQASPPRDELLPAKDFRLYAVCVRHPQNLAKSGILRPVSEGVWDAVLPGVATIRIIVVRRLPRQEQNALLQMFSAQVETLRYARTHYPEPTSGISTVWLRLFRLYQGESGMGTKLEEFAKRELRELLEELPPELRMAGLPPEKRMAGLSPAQRIKGLSPEELLDGLTPEQVEKVLDKLRRRKARESSDSDSN